MRAIGLLTLLTVCVGLTSLAAPASAEDGSSPGVPDVVGQFIGLKHHGEAVGWRLPENLGAPDPSLKDHYQGVVRYPGAGVPVFYISQLDDDDTDSQGGTTGGYVLVVRMGTRATDGERLRSNLQKRGEDTEDTEPAAQDTWIQSIRFNGIGVQVDGHTLRPYKHPGGMAIVDNVLFVAADQPDGPGFGGTGSIMLFDLGFGGSWREAPQPLQVLSLSHGIDNLAVTPTSDGKYLIWANGAGGTETYFYRTNLGNLRDNALDLDLVQVWDPSSTDDFVSGGHTWATGFTAHQSSTFVREGSGTALPFAAPLYLIGMRNDSLLPSAGNDFADLYEVVPNAGAYSLIWIGSLNQHCKYDGAGRIGNFGTGNNAYVSPSGELLLYSVQHDDEDWAAPDFVRMAEFRHRLVNRPGSPLRKPGAAPGGPYLVDEGSTVSLTGAGVPAADRPWVELYDDRGGWYRSFEHPSGLGGDRSIVVDYDDRSKLELSDFRDLDGFNDKTTSVVWRMPVGMAAVLYDDHDFEDRRIVLRGTGETEYIYHLDSQVVAPGVVEHPGKSAGEKLDFNDKVSSMKFTGTPPVGGALTLMWDLDADGVFGESGAAAGHGSEIGATPTFSAASLDGPRAVTVALRACDGSASCGSASATVTVRNVAPVLTQLSATPTMENGTTTITAGIVEPSSTDALNLVVDWGDPLSPANSQVVALPAGTVGFTLTHQYLDDNPTATQTDSYVITVQVTDDDGGTTSSSTTVPVQNADPSVVVAPLRDETGLEIGGAPPLALVGLEIQLAGTFTDDGSLDTHAASIAWGDGNLDDLGAVTESLAGTHAYTAEGNYSIAVQVLDDDTGVATASTGVRVVSAAEAAQEVADELTEIVANVSATRSIARAHARLVGNSGGNGAGAANGAFTHLDQGNANAGLVKLRQAAEYLAAAQAADPTADLVTSMRVLALAAKSVVVSEISEEMSSPAPDTAAIAAAQAFVAAGDVLLLSGNAADAIESYRHGLLELSFS